MKCTFWYKMTLSGLHVLCGQKSFLFTEISEETIRVIRFTVLVSTKCLLYGLHCSLAKTTASFCYMTVDSECTATI